MSDAEADVYLSPAQVCELIPGMTPRRLSELRYLRKGPQFLKPGYKTVVYRERDVRTWLDACAVTTKN